MNQQTQVRTYDSPAAYRSGAAKAAKDGWYPVNVTEHRPRAGCLRIVTLGLITLIFPPKPKIVVTYARMDSSRKAIAPPASAVEPDWESSFSAPQGTHRGQKIVGVIAGIIIVIIAIGAFSEDDNETITPTKATATKSAAATATKTNPAAPTKTANNPDPTKTPKLIATSEPTRAIGMKPIGLVGEENEKLIVHFEEGEYTVEAFCDNTAMQVYVFEEGGDPNNQVLVTWPVSRSRLDEPSKNAIIPRDDMFQVEIYCDGEWGVRFEPA